MRKHCVCLLSLFFTLGIQPQEITILTEENPPFSYKKSEQVTGLMTDVVNELVRETGTQVRFHQLFPWARSYQIALNEKNVLIYPMTRDPEREDIFKWVGPISDNTKYLFRMKHREDIQVKSLQDATDYLVGAIRDGSMSHLLLANGFNEGKNLDLVADKATNTRRLFANRVDLVANTKLGMAYQAQIQGFNANDLAVAFAFPEGGGYYLAFSAQTSDKIMVRFRQALDKLKREGKLDEITAHYYSGLLYSQLPQ